MTQAKKILLLSKHLKLIPFILADLEKFYQINTDPFVRKYLWDDKIITRQRAKELLVLNQMYFNKKKFGLWKIQKNTAAEIIGYCGLWYFFEESEPQLIYALLKEYTGKGFAIEAARAILNYAFQELDFAYLTAAIDVPNLKSQKVAEKLGMVFTEEKTIDNKPLFFYKINRFNS